MMPFQIGILTPSYNRPDLLKRCIESVLAQDYSYWRLYVVDDCSTVDLEQFQQDYPDPRIRFTRMAQNAGVNRVRNTALDMAQHDQCDAIFLLDDDDYLPEQALRRVMQVVDTHPQAYWLVLNVTGHQRELAANTYIQQTFEFDYIADYLMGKKIRGDKSHLIHMQAIGDLRFSTQVRQGDEWTFFLALAKHQRCLACPDIVKIVDYQDQGLSAQLAKKHYSFPKIWLDTQKPFLCWFYRPLLRRAATRSLQSVLRFPTRVLRLWLQQLKLLAQRS